MIRYGKRCKLKDKTQNKKHVNYLCYDKHATCMCIFIYVRVTKTRKRCRFVNHTI